MPNLNQWLYLEGEVFTLMVNSQTTGTFPRLGWMSSTCPSRSTSTLPTCPVPGRLPVTTGNHAHWFLGATRKAESEDKVFTYSLPMMSHHPSSHQGSSPHISPAPSLSWVLWFSPSPQAVGGNSMPLSLGSALCPRSLPVSCGFLTPCPPPYKH